MQNEMRNRLIELIVNADTYDPYECNLCTKDDDYCDCCYAEKLSDHLIDNGVTVQECTRPLEEWHEDYGDVLWWKFPIEEPPYVGSPLDEKWPAYHTHWTPIVLPQPPKGEQT